MRTRWSSIGHSVLGWRIGLRRGLSSLLMAVALWGLVIFSTGCALPQVSAEDRLFLPITVELLDVAVLPKQTFEETPVGGLSALTYDVNRDVFYVLSDDRGQLAPPRFYTVRFQLDRTDVAAPKIQSINIESVTQLKDETGNPYDRDRLDPEGLVLSPRQTLFVSSEGVTASGSPPMLNEYDLQTGVLKTSFRLPERFIPAEASDDVADASTGEPAPPTGVRDNQGFEALTLSPTSSAGAFEPFRLFMATESAIAQDFDPDPENPLISRFLHYLIGPDQSTFISEYAYPLSLEPMGTVSNGLTELLALRQGGHFLSLERMFGIRGFEIKLFQIATGGATDISTLPRLNSLDSINPIRKQLVLDFATADSPVAAIDNIEAMTLGPPLPDGSLSLWLMSDDNFSADQETQIWLLRLTIA